MAADQTWSAEGMIRGYDRERARRRLLDDSGRVAIDPAVETDRFPTKRTISISLNCRIGRT